MGITVAQIGQTEISLVEGNIVNVTVDAIVNAANCGLAGGGGVDGAIHRAGGPTIMEACRRIGGCPTGSARITEAGNLRAKHVIHAVAPIYGGGKRGEPEKLRGAYKSSLELAEAHDVDSIAFPSLGTGAYRYPVRDAAHIALTTVVEHLRAGSRLRRVQFVLFSAGDLRVYAEALERVLGPERGAAPDASAD